MKRFSHTRISTYKQCKQQYKYKYIDDVESRIDNTIEGFMGDIVHRALEKLYEDLKYEKWNDKADLIDWYESTWEDEWSEDVLVVKDEYDAKHYKKKGKTMISDYYDRYHPFDQATTIGIETQHRYDVTDEHTVSIRIDRLDSPEPGVYEIHDYKTSNHLPTQQEAEEDTQLATYALGIKDMYPDAEEVRLIWHYLGFDREVVVTKSDEELDVIEEQLVGVIHDIEENDEYPPTRSPLCDYCGYQKRCPAWKHKFDDELGDIDARSLAEDYISLQKEKERIEEEMKALEGDLSAYMDANNIERVFDDNGRSIYRWTKDVIKFPRNAENQGELWEALEGLGLLEAYQKVDTWNLEQDFGELNQIQQEVLDQLGEDKRLERFYCDD